MKPYSNLTNEELFMLLKLQLRSGRDAIINDKLLSLIKLSLIDSWNPVKDFDGCSIVQDRTHPDIACYLHDWLWITGKGGHESNILFYNIMQYFGYSHNMAKIRFIAVSIAWSTIYKYKNKNKISNVDVSLVFDILNDINKHIC